MTRWWGESSTSTGLATSSQTFRATQLPHGDIVIEVADTKIQGLSATFADADGLLALIGSHGYLEIAENLASAAQRLGIRVGDAVIARAP